MGSYDYEPPVSKGKFLRLKVKDEAVTVRIVSEPYRQPVVWKKGVQRPLSDEDTLNLKQSQWAAIFGDPNYEVRESFSWVVIDRSDGQARIFTGGTMIFLAIKAYAQNTAWGDPTGYDIEIVRTEVPGNYYKVTALPVMTPLTENENQLALSVDIGKELPAAAPLGEPQIDDITDWMNGKRDENQSLPPKYEHPQYDASGKPQNQAAIDEQKSKDASVQDDEPTMPENTSIEDIGGQPVNLDDIPF